MKNELLKVTNDYYSDINLEDTPILERDLIENKMGVLDVKVVVNKKNDIDIKMQVIKSKYIAERLLWYQPKMYSSSINKGEGYSSTKKVIMDEMAIRDSGYNDSKKEGIKEGIERGIEKGKNEGLKIEKKLKSIKITKEMLKENLYLVVISKVIDLSSDELKKV